jgi:DNA modification methylase
LRFTDFDTLLIMPLMNRPNSKTTLIPNEHHFDEILKNFFDEYDGINPIEISFRKLINNFSAIERATHSIHPYPAKLLGHIPFFFINNSILTKPKDIILDPFCGSGTVLLEAIIAKRYALGVDSNPLARLISSTKTVLCDVDKILKTKEEITNWYNEVIQKDNPQPSVINLDFWYSKEIAKQLSAILECIKKIDEEDIRNFFLTSFSVCARKVSVADPRVSVPVKLKTKSFEENYPLRRTHAHLLESLKTINVLQKFIEIVEQNQKRILNLSNLYDKSVSARIIGTDAKSITNEISSNENLGNESVDFIITSPPYAGAQKYIRASSLNLNWTELATAEELKILDNKTIGRESYRINVYSKFQETSIPEANVFLNEVFKINPLRAYIASNYLNEMQKVISELYRVLKKEKYFVLVAANNFVCGKEFLTQTYLKELATNIGFKVELELVDDIHSYGLMTKRNKTASLITREIVTIFKKI